MALEAMGNVFDANTQVQPLNPRSWHWGVESGGMASLFEGLGGVVSWVGVGVGLVGFWFWSLLVGWLVGLAGWLAGWSACDIRTLWVDEWPMIKKHCVVECDHRANWFVTLGWSV